MTNTPNKQNKKEISAEEFVNIWKGAFLNNTKYEEFYDKNHSHFVKVTFRDYKVIGSVIVENEDINNILSLINCETDFILIKNSRIGFIGYQNSNIQNFQLKDSHIDKFWFTESQTGPIIGTNTSLNTFKIDCSVIGSKIDFRNMKIDVLSILNKSKTANIFLSKASKATNILIGNSVIGNINLYEVTNRYCKIENSTLAGFSVLGNTIIEAIDITNSSTISRLEYNNSTIIDTSISNEVKIEEFSLLYLLTDSKKLSVEGCQINDFDIDIDKPYQITIEEHYDHKTNKYTPTTIQNLHLDSTVFPNHAYLHISQTHINDIYFNSFLNHGTIILNGVGPYRFDVNINVDKLNEKKSMSNVKNMEKQSSFEISNSDLGNTQFIGCDLDMYDTFEFHNSKILEVFIADSTLPTRNMINEGAVEFEQRRLALSQFKKIYENQGDVVRATQFRAEEMEVYREQLRIDYSNFMSKEWWDNRSERFNLWLNMFSNYYGNNWLKAVGWTLLFNSILFTFYCRAQGYTLGTNLDIFGTLAAYSFEFLNPLRKADFLEHITGNHPGAGAITIDYISRIIMAYFVYQTISAFRKFGKRSV